MRIAFIAIYFGSVPWYFRFFKESCLHNPDVDFILITDIDLKDHMPDNIIPVRSSLGGISKQATDKLGFEISMNNPYKLCDLRPAYGLIFSDLLKGYDFWGHCDIDLVLGNIRSFITEDILNKHEIVTTKREYIAGFFSLFRNNEKINNLFKKSADYREAFQDPTHYDFDECNWEWAPLLKGKEIGTLNSEIESITHVVKKAERAGDVTVYWHSMEYHPGEIVWDRGELFDSKGKRVLLCHFIYFKQLGFKYVPKWKTTPARFYINSFYFSKYTPGSVVDRWLRSILMTARVLKGRLNILNQYMQWGPAFLFASRKIDLKTVPCPAGLEGYYRTEKLIIRVFLVDHCLHINWKGSQFSFFHKGAGQFILGKCRFQQLINMKLNFQFNEYNSAYMLQMTASGLLKLNFFKISRAL